MLLGLGTALLVVAAIVFAAVSWSRLSALGQGALLVGLTIGAGAATWAAARRGLQGTAEAFGVLTVVMGPLVAQAIRVTLDLGSIDDRSWGNALAWGWWPLSLAVIGLAALGFGRAVGVRGARYAGAVAVQLGPLLWLALAPISPELVAIALLAQATAILAVVASVPADRPVAGRAIWRAGAWLTWVSGASTALVVGFAGVDGAAPAIGVLVVAVAAACAGVVAFASQRSGAIGPAGSWAAVATGLALAAVLRALLEVVSDEACWPAIGLVAVLVVAAAVRSKAEVAPSVAATATLAAGLASMPVLVAGTEVLAAMGEVTADAWGWAASDVVAVDGSAVVGWALPSLALVVGLALAWLPRLGRAAVLAVGAVVVATGAVVAPVLAGAPIGTVTLLALAATAALAVLARPATGAELFRVATGVAAATAAAWASATIELTLLALAVGFGLALWAVAAALADAQAPLGAVGGAGAVVAAGGLLVVGGFAAEADAAWIWAAAGTYAVVAGALMAVGTALPAGEERRQPVVVHPDRPSPPAGAYPDPEPWPVRIVAAVAAQEAAVAGHLLALVVLVALAAERTVTAPLSLALAVGAAGAVAVGWGPWRGRGAGVVLVALGAAEALALCWFRLAEADVRVPEAYALPFAALVAAAAVAAAVEREGGWRAARSWELEGPPLAIALLPTAFVALEDPGLSRTLVCLVVGALLLAVGAAAGRRAPIDLGALVVVVVGGQALLPYAAEVPRWVSLGLVGAVLVALGATFEERRKDVSEARRRYSSLR